MRITMSHVGDTFSFAMRESVAIGTPVTSEAFSKVHPLRLRNARSRAPIDTISCPDGSADGDVTDAVLSSRLFAGVRLVLL